MEIVRVDTPVLRVWDVGTRERRWGFLCGAAPHVTVLQLAELSPLLVAPNTLSSCLPSQAMFVLFLSQGMERLSLSCLRRWRVQEAPGGGPAHEAEALVWQ